MESKVLILRRERCPLCGTLDDMLDVRHGQLRVCRECAERRRKAERTHTIAVLLRKAMALTLVAALGHMLLQPAMAAPAGSFRREALVPTAAGELKVTLAGSRSLVDPTASEAAIVVSEPYRGLWREVARLDFTADAEAVMQELSVGGDVLVIHWPLTGSAAATVSVNGQEVAVSSATVAAAAAAVREGVAPSTDVPEAEALENALSAISDPAGFAAGLMALGLVLDDVSNPGDVDPMGGAECVWRCWSCATALAGYGISIGGLIAACGATLGLGCILALLGHEVAAAVVLSACTQCLLCLRDGPSGGTDVDPSEPVPIDQRGGGGYQALPAQR